MRFISLRIFRKPRVIVPLIITGILAAGLLMLQTGKRDTINIAFLGTFSGDGASDSLRCADGALLAIEDCNAIGGIGNRMVRLELADDRGDAATAAELVNLLASRHCAAIIGPTSPKVCQAAADAARQHQLMLISPIVTVDACQGGSEGFASIRVSASVAAEYIAHHVRFRANLTRPAIVIDPLAKSYVPPMASLLSQALADVGATVAQLVELPSKAQRNYGKLTNSLFGSDADSIIIFAEGAETALLLQHLRSVGSELPVIVYEPNSPEELVNYAGAAAQQVTVISSIMPSAQVQRYRSFVDRFYKRFGRTPDIAAVNAYDATRLCLLSIAEAQDLNDVRRTMLARQSFDGLQGRISIGPSASPKRELRAYRIRNGVAVPFN